MDGNPTNLRFSVQRAMLGEVTANLAALTAGLVGNEISIIVTFFSAPTDEDEEAVECMATEVLSDYPAPFMIRTEFRMLAEGRPRPLDFWAFIRSGVHVS